MICCKVKSGYKLPISKENPFIPTDDHFLDWVDQKGREEGKGRENQDT